MTTGEKDSNPIPERSEFPLDDDVSAFALDTASETESRLLRSSRRRRLRTRRRLEELEEQRMLKRELEDWEA